MSYAIFCDFCPVMSAKYTSATAAATEIIKFGWDLRVENKVTKHRCPACKRDGR